MKIAELSTRYPPGPGGVERHVRELAVRLAARGHQVDAFASDLVREYPMERLPARVPREQVLDGVSIHRLPVWSLPGELHYPFFRGLDRALVRMSPDVVHAHTYGTNHAAVARRYARSTGRPFVLTAHYHPIWSIEGGWLRHRIRGFYDRQLAAPIVASARVVVVQTREEERLLRSPGLQLPKVEIVPPGYTPLPPPSDGDRPFARSIGVEGPFLLFVGRLASNKGLLGLVDAFSTLAARDPRASLVLVGADGGMRAAIERKVAQLGLGERVRIPGYVEDERRLASAFCEARLFVLPSEYEAFGLVLLEALAQGTPVVASRVGGIPEFLEDGKAGRLVPPNDPTALAAAIGQLWDDEETRLRFGRYGRDVVVPRYSWDRVADELERIFREVANGR
ncbi:MAG: glycosyltransferase family 4 protein [Thermoplasmata archaeon]|nr:glycosyltransferase family 4 protein [Thermoplasmata archaeon]MCI4356604.1 glycosyltransferase family 4 protein [Thermoplasmata archaeon]